MGSRAGYLKLIAKDPDYMKKIGSKGGKKKVSKGPFGGRNRK